MSSTARYDATADSIKISSYRGTTLLGPNAQLTKKIYANETYTAGEANFTTSSFRILGTAAGSLIDAKVYLVCPLTFGSLCGTNMNDAPVNAAGAGMLWNGMAIGPRRNGLWKAFSSVSTTVNSSVSFNVRPRESERQMNDIFSDGSLPSEMGHETGTLGPDHCIQPEQFNGNRDLTGVVAAQFAGAAGFTGAGGPLNVWPAYGEFFDQYGPGSVEAVNGAFARRRADFLGGLTAADAGRKVQYDMVTCLQIPPFASHKMEPYQRTPTQLPWISSIDVTCHWETLYKQKLLITKNTRNGMAVAGNDYHLTWAKKPYLLVTFRQPPFVLTRPVSIGAHRTVSYTQTKSTADVNGVWQAAITLANTRFDSWPPLLVISAQVAESKATPTGDAVGQAARMVGVDNNNRGIKYRDYNCRLSGLSITVNERQKIMTDMTDYELYQIYKRNTRSKYTFRQWRDCRCAYVLRSSDLCLETGENVYDPITLSIELTARNPIGEVAEAKAIRLSVLSIYTSEALTLSSQSASVTGLLLSKTDYRDLVAGKRAKEPAASAGPSIADYS